MSRFTPSPSRPVPPQGLAPGAGMSPGITGCTPKKPPPCEAAASPPPPGSPAKGVRKASEGRGKGTGGLFPAPAVLPQRQGFEPDSRVLGRRGSTRLGAQPRLFISFAVGCRGRFGKFPLGGCWKFLKIKLQFSSWG